MAKFTFDDFMKAKKEGRVRWDTDALNRDLEQSRGVLGSVSRQQMGQDKLWGYDEIEKNRKTISDLSGRSGYLRAYINSMKGSEGYDELNDAYEQMSRGLRSAGQYLDRRQSYTRPNSGTLIGSIEETMHPTLRGLDPEGYEKQAQGKALDEQSRALYMVNKYGSSLKTLEDVDRAKESAEDADERSRLDGYKLSIVDRMSDDEARRAYIGEKNEENRAILKNRIERGEEKSRQKRYEGLSFDQLMGEAQKPEKSSDERKWLRDQAFKSANPLELQDYMDELSEESKKLAMTSATTLDPKEKEEAERRRDEIGSEMNAVRQQITEAQARERKKEYEWVRNKPDFEENSGYRGKVDGADTYNHINAEKARTGEISRESIDYIDDEQRKVYNYLYNTEGAEIAERYIESLTPELNRRMTEAHVSRAYSEGETNPFVASAVSVGKNLVSGVGIVEDIVNSIAKRPVDVNSRLHLNAHETTAYRQGVASGIDKSMKGAGAPEWIQGVPSWGYEAGMSAVDSAVTMAVSTLVTAGVGEIAGAAGTELSAETMKTITSTTSSMIMGSQVATQTVIEAKNRGLSDDQAVTMGVLYGIVEGLSEKYSIETILKEPTSIKNMLAKAFIAEGSEEVVANWGDRIVDGMIEIGSDRLTEEYKNLRKEGYSELQASLMVFWNCVKDDASAFLAGGLSGLAMSGAHTAVSKTQEGVSTGILKLAERLGEKMDKVSAAQTAMNNEGWDIERFIEESRAEAREQKNTKAQKLLDSIERTAEKHGADSVSYADVANVLTVLERGSRATTESEAAGTENETDIKKEPLKAYNTVRAQNGGEIRSYNFGENHKNGIIMTDSKGEAHTIVAVESSEAYHGERENSVVLRDSEGRSYGADELSASDSDINALLGIASSYRTRGAQALMANWESYKSHAEEQGREASLGEYQKYFFALYNAGVTGLDADTTQSSAIYRGAYSALGLRAARSATASGYNDGAQRFARRARVLQKLRIPGLKRSIESRVYIPEGAGVRLSDNTKALLHGVASRIGRDIVLDEGLDGSVNGLFDPTDGKLHLRADINDSYAVAAVLHEAVHSIADVNPEGYEALRAFVMNYHALIGNDVEAMIELKGAEYGEKAPTREARIEEIVANTVMALAADEKALNRAIGIEKNKSLLEKVAEVIKELAQRVKRFIRENTTNEEAKAILDDAEALDMLAELFAQAADEAKENLSGMNEGAIEKENAHRGARYAKNNITQKNISSIQRLARSRGKISINDFTSSELHATAKFAEKFWSEMGVKSPYFRAWFGDWRAHDTGAVKIIDVKNSEYSTKSRTVVCKDLQNGKKNSGRIKIESKLFEDSIYYANVNGDKKAIIKLLSHIDEIIANGVLLDTQLSDDKSNKQASTTFMHYLYCPVEYNGAPFVAKIAVEEYDVDGKRKAYNAQRIKMSALPRAHFRLTNQNGYAKARKIRLQADEITIADLHSLVKQFDKKFNPKEVEEAFLNEDGTPKHFYHGTKFYNGWYEFKNNSNSHMQKGTSVASWFSDSLRMVNDAYGSKGNNHEKVFDVYLRCENPLTIECGGAAFNHIHLPKELRGKGINKYYNPVSGTMTDSEYAGTEQIAKYAKRSGYDGVVFKNVVDGRLNSGIQSNVCGVFDSEQIKSATDNIGTFDRSNPDIRYAVNDVIDEEYDAPLSDDEEQALWDDEAQRREVDLYSVPKGESYFDSHEDGDIGKLTEESSESAVMILSGSAQNTAEKAIRGFKQFELDEGDLESMVEDIAKDYEIDLEENPGIAGELRSIVTDFIAQVEEGRISTHMAVSTMTKRIGQELERAETWCFDSKKEEIRNGIKDELKLLRFRPIIVRDYAESLLAKEYGSYKEYRNRMFGKVSLKLARNIKGQAFGLNMSDVTDRLKKRFGESLSVFDKEADIAPNSEMESFIWLERVLNGSYDKVFANPWLNGEFENVNTAAMTMAYDMIGRVIEQKRQEAQHANQDSADLQKKSTETIKREFIALLEAQRADIIRKSQEAQAESDRLHDNLGFEKVNSRSESDSTNDKTEHGTETLLEKYENKLENIKKQRGRNKDEIIKQRQSNRDRYLKWKKETVSRYALKNSRRESDFVRSRGVASVINGIRRLANTFENTDKNATKQKYFPQEVKNAGVVKALDELANKVLFKPDSHLTADQAMSKGMFLPGLNGSVGQAVMNLKAALSSLVGGDQSGDYGAILTGDFLDEMERLAKELQDDPNKLLSLENARTIYGYMKVINHAINHAREQIGRKESITNRVSGERVINGTLELGKKKGIIRLLYTARGMMLNSKRMARMYSGYNDDSEFMYHTNELEKGWVKWQDWSMDARKAFMELTESSAENRKAYRDSLNKVINVTFTENNGEKRTVRMTRMQGLTILMTWQRELTDGHLVHMQTGGIEISDPKTVLKGMVKISDIFGENTQRIRAVNIDFIKAVEDQMTDFEREYRKIAERYFNETSRDAINEVMLKLWHREIADSKYYIPILVDKDFIGTHDSELSNINDVKVNTVSIENCGSYKSTVPRSQKPIRILSLNTIIDKHINETGQLYGLGIPVRNMKRAFNTVRDDQKSVRSAFSEVFGKDAVKYINNMMTDIEAPRSDADEFGGKLESALRKGFAHASLVFNGAVAMKQTASFLTAARYINIAHLTTAWGSFFRHNVGLGRLHALMEEIDSHTPLHFIRRVGLTSSEIADLQTRLGSKLNSRLPKASVILNPEKWIQGMDCLTTAVLWDAAKNQIGAEYRKSKGKIGSEEYWQKVTELYERTIMDTQPMYDSLHRSEAQKSRNAIARSATRFATQPFQNSGILFDALGEMIAKHDKKSVKGFANAVGSQLASALIFAGMSFLGAMMRHKKKRYLDEDGDLTFWSIAGGILKDFGEGLVRLLAPIGGDVIYSLITNMIGGKGFSNEAFENAEFSAINKLISTVIDLWNYAGKLSEQAAAGSEIDGEKVARTFANAICSALDVTGVPATNIKNAVYSVIGYLRDGFKYGGNALTDNSGQFTDEYLPNKIYNALNDGDVDKAKELEAIWRKELMAGGMSEEKALEKIKGKLVDKLTEDESVVAAAQSKYDGDYSAYDKARQRVIDLGFDENDVDSAITRNYNKLNGEDKTEKEAVPEGKTAFDDTGGRKFSKKDAFNALVRGDEKSFELARKYLEDNGVDEKELTSYMRSRSTTESLWDRYFTAYQKSDSKTMKELKAVLVRIYGSEEEFKLKVSGKNGKGGYYEKWNEKSIE